MSTLMIAKLTAVIFLVFGSYAEVLRTDLVAHAKIRWSRVDAGQRIVVEIEGGRAKRTNPNWSPEPQRLAYDLGKERELSRVIKWAQLPAPGHQPSLAPTDRTLEIIVEDDKGWHSAGYWSMSKKLWQKGRYGSVFDPLEALMKEDAELFDEKPVNNQPQGGFVPR
jgi:hypothetical protein